MAKLNRWGKNVFLVCVSLAIAVGLGELAVRAFAPQTTLFPRFTVSDEYPIAFPANSKLVHSQGDRWKFIYTTNRLGKRGPYVPVSEARDKQAVVVLGDSFTFGIGVSDQDTYAQVMRERLGDGYPVINGGTGGWGLDSEIKWFHRVGEKYDPEVVVLQFTANDPRDFAGVTTVENGGFRFHPDPSEKPTWQRWLSETGLIQKSHLYSLTRRVYGQLGGGNPGGSEGKANSRSRSPEPGQRYVEMLELFAEKLRQDTVKLFFVSVTYPTGESAKHRYDIDRFPLIAEAVCRMDTSGALEFIELPLEEMGEYRGSPEGHQWGRKHHELVGSRLADAIVAGPDQPSAECARTSVAVPVRAPIRTTENSGSSAG